MTFRTRYSAAALMLFAALAPMTAMADSSGAIVDRSGATSSAPGEPVRVFAARPGRQFARITNLTSGNSTGTMYVYDKASGTPTTSNSVPLLPGASIVWDASDAVGPIVVFSTMPSVTYEAGER